MKLNFLKKILILIISISFFIISDSNIYGNENIKEKNQVLSGKDFYANFSTVVFFQRDSYLDSLINKSISAKGTLQIIDRKVKKKYKAVFLDIESSKYGFKIFYYLYFSDSDFINSMKDGEVSIFNGKLSGWTPLDSQKKEFIFEINLEEISLENK